MEVRLRRPAQWPWHGPAPPRIYGEGAPTSAGEGCSLPQHYDRVSGYARLLTEEELQKHHHRCWYLPHHAVTSASKPDKFRVVFDAAARFAGTSRNENLLTGPDLLKQIPGVLLRFRQQPVALIADIEQMFLQVAVREDQPALRFLWRDLETDRPPNTYQMD